MEGKAAERSQRKSNESCERDLQNELESFDSQIHPTNKNDNYQDNQGINEQQSSSVELEGDSECEYLPGDFRIEIEKRFNQSQVNKHFKFPREQEEKDDANYDDACSSEESVDEVYIYNLHEQNSRNYQKECLAFYEQSEQQSEQSRLEELMRQQREENEIIEKEKKQYQLRQQKLLIQQVHAQYAMTKRIQTEGNQVKEKEGQAEVRNKDFHENNLKYENQQSQQRSCSQSENRISNELKQSNNDKEFIPKSNKGHCYTHSDTLPMSSQQQQQQLSSLDKQQKLEQKGIEGEMSKLQNIKVVNKQNNFNINSINIQNYSNNNNNNNQLTQNNQFNPNEINSMQKQQLAQRQQTNLCPGENTRQQSTNPHEIKSKSAMSNQVRGNYSITDSKPNSRLLTEEERQLSKYNKNGTALNVNINLNLNLAGNNKNAALILNNQQLVQMAEDKMQGQKKVGFNQTKSSLNNYSNNNNKVAPIINKPQIGQTKTNNPNKINSRRMKTEGNDSDLVDLVQASLKAQNGDNQQRAYSEAIKDEDYDETIDNFEEALKDGSDSEDGEVALLDNYNSTSQDNNYHIENKQKGKSEAFSKNVSKRQGLSPNNRAIKAKLKNGQGNLFDDRLINQPRASSRIQTEQPRYKEGNSTYYNSSRNQIDNDQSSNSRIQTDHNISYQKSKQKGTYTTAFNINGLLQQQRGGNSVVSNLHHLKTSLLGQHLSGYNKQKNAHILSYKDPNVGISKKNTDKSNIDGRIPSQIASATTQMFNGQQQQNISSNGRNRSVSNKSCNQQIQQQSKIQEGVKTMELISSGGKERQLLKSVEAQARNQQHYLLLGVSNSQNSKNKQRNANSFHLQNSIINNSSSGDKSRGLVLEGSSLQNNYFANNSGHSSSNNKNNNANNLHSIHFPNTYQNAHINTNASTLEASDSANGTLNYSINQNAKRNVLSSSSSNLAVNLSKNKSQLESQYNKSSQQQRLNTIDVGSITRAHTEVPYDEDYELSQIRATIVPSVALSLHPSQLQKDTSQNRKNAQQQTQTKQLNSHTVGNSTTQKHNLRDSLLPSRPRPLHKATKTEDFDQKIINKQSETLPSSYNQFKQQSSIFVDSQQKGKVQASSGSNTYAFTDAKMNNYSNTFDLNTNLISYENKKKNDQIYSKQMNQQQNININITNNNNISYKPQLSANTQQINSNQTVSFQSVEKIREYLQQKKKHFKQANSLTSQPAGVPFSQNEIDIQQQYQPGKQVQQQYFQKQMR